MATKKGIGRGYFIYKYYINDELKYVGKSVSPYRRYKSHCVADKRYNKIDRIDIAVCNFEHDMDILEKYYISKLKPEWNIVDINYDWSSSSLKSELTFISYTLEEFKFIFNSFPCYDELQWEIFNLVYNTNVTKIQNFLPTDVYALISNNQYLASCKPSVVALDVCNIIRYSGYNWYEYDKVTDFINNESNLSYRQRRCVDLMLDILEHVGENIEYGKFIPICQIDDNQMELIDDDFNVIITIASADTNEISFKVFDDFRLSKDNILEVKLSYLIHSINGLTSFKDNKVRYLHELYTKNSSLFAPILIQQSSKQVYLHPNTDEDISTQIIKHGHFICMYYINNTLKYINKTTNPRKDFLQLCETRPHFNNINAIEVARCESEIDMHIYELYYISMLQPEWNISANKIEQTTIQILNTLVFTRFTVEGFLNTFTGQQPSPYCEPHTIQHF